MSSCAAATCLLCYVISVRRRLTSWMNKKFNLSPKRLHAGLIFFIYIWLVLSAWFHLTCCVPSRDCSKLSSLRKTPLFWKTNSSRKLSRFLEKRGRLMFVQSLFFFSFDRNTIFKFFVFNLQSQKKKSRYTLNINTQNKIKTVLPFSFRIKALSIFLWPWTEIHGRWMFQHFGSWPLDKLQQCDILNSIKYTFCNIDLIGLRCN